MLLSFTPCLTKIATQGSKKKVRYGLDMHRAQDHGGQNEPSASLVPSLVSSSTGITNVDRGILRLTASCVLLLTRAVKKEAGESVARVSPCSPCFCQCWAGPHLYCLATWRGNRQGRPGPGFRGTGDVTFGRVHRVLYSPQSDRCCCGLLLGQCPKN